MGQMMKIGGVVLAVVMVWASGVARAQSFNIEWGSAGSAPSSSYGARGVAGVWNTLDSMPNFERFSLVGLDGAPIGATIMNIGFDAVEGADIPGTSGDDEAMLDDCLVSYNDPIDGCLFIDNMEPGTYRVVMYGLAPDDAGLLSRLRIDQNSEDPVHVGGAWSGAHELGVTYMEQLAFVGADGNLDVHSGLQGANVRSVLNAMQVVAEADDCMADLDGSGDLDFFDLSALLNGEVDYNGDTSFDFFDISSYLMDYSAGCP